MHMIALYVFLLLFLIFALNTTPHRVFWSANMQCLKGLYVLEGTHLPLIFLFDSFATHSL